VLLVPALGRALGDPDRSVARAASDSLVELSARADVSGVLTECLHGDDLKTRWGAAFTSARLAPPTLRLLPALVGAMASPDGDVRWAAARIVVDLARVHPEVVTVVIGLASEAEAPEARRMAVFALRDLAADAPRAEETWLRATEDPDLRRGASRALARIEAAAAP